MSKTIVIAIGGNSLIKNKNKQTLQDQWQCIKKTCCSIADIYKSGDKLVVTHGNGPQVGFILLRSDHCKDFLHTVPLDICNAETQGAIGYQIQQSLRNEFDKQKIANIEVTTIVTQVIVNAKDPGFDKPTKPIGSFYTKEEADVLQKEKGWSMIKDSNRGYRCVVSSPKPVEIVEICTIKKLLEMGNILITCGGGGIPVVRENDGLLHSREAVVDKDFTSALLASEINADVFIISTAVPEVSIRFGKIDQKNIKKMTVAEAKKYTKEGHFASGSMLPKIEAAINYLENGGKKVIITNPSSLAEAVAGNAGTHISH